MTLKTKYGSRLVPKGTPVRPASLEEALPFFQNIKFNPSSPFIAVVIQGYSFPTIMVKKEIEFCGFN